MLACCVCGRLICVRYDARNTLRSGMTITATLGAWGKQNLQYGSRPAWFVGIWPEPGCCAGRQQNSNVMRGVLTVLGERSVADGWSHLYMQERRGAGFLLSCKNSPRSIWFGICHARDEYGVMSQAVRGKAGSLLTRLKQLERDHDAA